MKNVYLYIMFLLICFSSFGQDLQNANWLFGDYDWLRFSGNPTTLSSPPGNNMNIHEGCASVSDENGNLLFYTNGMKVWSNNHQPMENGNNTLISSASNTQGVIIVPKPGNTKIYYVIYIDGFTGGKKGLRYSEVDMSTSLGKVILSSRNTILKDHNGVYIKEDYYNASEKLTSTKHANGIDYWVVACIRNYVYSYLVTANGITLQNYTTGPINIPTSSPNNNNPGPGTIKISPNNQRIAICYLNGAEVNGYTAGGIVTGTFNSSTGGVVLNPITLLDISPYGLEFSPDSNNIYFNSLTVGSYPRKLYLMTPSGSYTQKYDFGANDLGTMQLGIDGKIYIAKFWGKKMAVINNPNNAANPNIDDNTISLSGSSTSNSYGYGGIPQWVHWQEACPSDLVLTSTLFDVLAPTQDNRQASNTITASNVINNGAIGVYHAGEDIVFKHGFSSANGSVFRAYIEGCSDEFEGLRAPAEEETTRTASIDEESEKELFTLYPNPATENVTINSDKVMQNITVTSLDGFILFQGAVKANSYELNVSSYRKGIYIITVTTEDGEMEMKKLIKE